MNWWEILKIPYDSDLKTIKKSYAKLLKTNNPEDNPEGYQILRQAYDTAVNYVKHNKNLHHDSFENNENKECLSIDNNDKEIVTKKQFEDNNDSYDNNKENLLSDYQDTENTFYYQTVTKNTIDNSYDDESYIKLKIEQFLNKLNKIYNHPSTKNSTYAWEDLLNDDVVWNINTSAFIEDSLFRFSLNNKDLCYNVLYLLNYNFKWTCKEMDLCKKYNSADVTEFINLLMKVQKLKYEYIKEIDPNLIEKYLSLKEEGNLALSLRNYDEAGKYLLEAYEIFNSDVELFKSLGEYYKYTKNLEKALEFFKLYFEENKSELDIALLIGKLSMQLFMFSEALPYIEFCFNCNPDNKQLLIDLGHCHLANSDLLKAKEVFEEYLKFNSKNRYVKKLLKKINKLLEKQSDNNPDLHQINDSNNINPKIVVINKRSRLKSIFTWLLILFFTLRLSLKVIQNYYNKPEKNIKSKTNNELKLNDSIKDSNSDKSELDFKLINNSFE